VAAALADLAAPCPVRVAPGGSGEPRPVVLVDLQGLDRRSAGRVHARVGAAAFGLGWLLAEPADRAEATATLRVLRPHP